MVVHVENFTTLSPTDTTPVLSHFSVVWNPWAEKAAAMSDFGDDEFVNMVCVEAGSVSAPRSLPAKQTFQCHQVLSSRM